MNESIDGYILYVEHVKCFLKRDALKAGACVCIKHRISLPCRLFARAAELKRLSEEGEQKYLQYPPVQCRWSAHTHTHKHRQGDNNKVVGRLPHECVCVSLFDFCVMYVLFEFSKGSAVCMCVQERRADG